MGSVTMGDRDPDDAVNGRKGVGSATAIMAMWILGLTIVWAPGLLGVPALGPWCDYFHPRMASSSFDPDFGERTFCPTYDHVETSWTPPGVRCATASSSLGEHGHIGGQYPLVGNTPLAVMLQVLLFAIPLLVWWAPPRGVSDTAIRRWAAGMMIGGGVGLTGWSVLGFIDGSVSLAVVYLALGFVLTTSGVFFRHTHGASVLEPYPTPDSDPDPS